MTSVRRRLPCVIVSWVLLHAGTAFAGPVVLLASPAAAGEVICECPGTTADQQCPMHRHGGSGHESKPLDPGQCAMRAAHAGFDVALLSFTISAAVPVDAQLFLVPDAEAPVFGRLAFLAGVPAHPDLPPPRA